MDGIWKALAYVFVIVLGYLLKHFGFVKKEDGKTLCFLMLNVTLPAAVVVSFSQFTIQPSLFILMLLGFTFNLMMLGIGRFLSRKNAREEKVFYTLCTPGYNIGACTMPFITGFFGPSGVVAACMFDTGNAVMCSGFTYAMASSISGQGKLTPLFVLKKMFFTVPFDFYIAMLLLSTFQVTVPQPVVTVASVVANANGFLAMLMIGVLFELQKSPSALKDVGMVLGFRYGIAVVLALLVNLLAPFDPEIKKVLTILIFAPIPSMCTPFTEQCKGRVEVTTFATSISIVVSVVITIFLLTT